MVARSATVAPRAQHNGTEKVLVLLVDFPNRPAVGTTAAQWNSKLFAGSASVQHFYHEVSSDGVSPTPRLTMAPAEETHGTANDGVVGWLRMSSNHPDTRENTSTPNRQLVYDALLAADPYVNFKSFDKNNNNALDMSEIHVCVIAAGYETSYGGSSSRTPSVWGHRWALGWSPVFAPTLDGVKVCESATQGGYTMMGEYHATGTSTGHSTTIGIICHELGHDISWPDLYDTDGSSEGVGNWCLMSGGSWGTASGGYSGSSPCHPNSFLKSYQGWLTPQKYENGIVPVPRVGTSNSVVQILDNPNGVNWGSPGAGEYFLIENRQRVGYDYSIPAAGLLIWHIDESRSSNSADGQRMVDLEEADGRGDLDLGTNGGDSGDVFPGTSNNRRFAMSSNPPNVLYTGANPMFELRDISNSSATMSGTLRKLTGAADFQLYE